MRVALFALLVITSTCWATSAAAQQGAPGPTVTTSTSTYIRGTIPDEEAVSLRIRAESFPGPLLTVLDDAGVESDCLLPCTLRMRVGTVTIEGPRLSVDVALEAAGLTYDVGVTAGATGEDLALVTTLVVTGGLAFGLGIWGLTVDSRSDDLHTLAAIGAVYGGIALGISLPWLIVLLVNLNGSASVSFSRGLSAALTPNGLAITF